MCPSCHGWNRDTMDCDTMDNFHTKKNVCAFLYTLDCNFRSREQRVPKSYVLGAKRVYFEFKLSRSPPWHYGQKKILMVNLTTSGRNWRNGNSHTNSGFSWKEATKGMQISCAFEFTKTLDSFSVLGLFCVCDTMDIKVTDTLFSNFIFLLLKKF